MSKTFPPQAQEVPANAEDDGGGGNRTRATFPPFSQPEIREIASMEYCAEGWLYFIQQGGDGPIKIGRATNVRRRLSELRDGSPDELYLIAAIRGGADLERDVHAALRDYWIRGEWFEADAVLTYLAAELGFRYEVLEEYGYLVADGDVS
jgi:hypothetical protein